MGKSGGHRHRDLENQLTGILDILHQLEEIIGLLQSRVEALEASAPPPPIGGLGEWFDEWGDSWGTQYRRGEE